MTWMLVSQTILFGLWGGLFAGEVKFLDAATPYYIDYNVLKFFEGLLCVASGIAGYGSYRSVDAAMQEIERIKSLYERAKIEFCYKKLPEEELFGMVVGKDIHHASGHIVTRWGPRFFYWRVVGFVFAIRAEAMGMASQRN
jgi:hypothetical protein